MIVLYSYAHSDPRGSPGASNLTGVCERTVAREAFAPLDARCRAEGFNVKEFSGNLSVSVRRMEREVKRARERYEKHVAIELHFNRPPQRQCQCGAVTWAGVPCVKCGAPPPTKWRFGHTALVNRWSGASIELADHVLGRLGQIISFSERRETIKMPDSRYGPKLWPRKVPPPAVLVEAGFGVDPEFSDWIADPINQRAYGMAVAEGICDYVRKREDLPLEMWGK